MTLTRSYTSMVLGLVCAGGLALSIPVAPRAQQPPQEPKKEDQKKEQKPGSLKDALPQRELSEKERKKRDEELLKELETHFKSWLEEDVNLIVLPEERSAFLELNTDEEREQFIEQFWLRRDPTPDTLENEYKEEHYRRIAYANERFASGIPGWKSDRGRIYIIHGPPDEIESYPAGGMYERTLEEGGGSTSVYPFERWRYRYIEGVDTDVILEFVDTSGTGEFRLTMDPSEKDALTLVPGAGLTLEESLGLSSKRDRFLRTDGTRLPSSAVQTARSNQFDRLRIFSAVQRPPEIKFKDLEEVVRTRISFNLLPFDVRTDYIRITDQTILVPVTIGVRQEDLTFESDQGIYQATVNVFGRVSTVTGKIVQTFEDVIQLTHPAASLEAAMRNPAVYQKHVPLRPGRYKLNVVLKDLNSGNMGTLEEVLKVPRFEEDMLANSSLILADLMERVPSKSIGSGQFVVGETKVRPLISRDFNQNDRMGVYLQVYNLGLDETTHKPDVQIQYSIQNGDETVFEYTETGTDLERAGPQITLEKVLPLASFQPGEYTLNIRITDKVRNQTIQPSAKFEVRKK